MDIMQNFLSKINSTKVLVIAGNTREFESFIDLALYKHAQEDAYDGYEFIYYSSEDSIRGMRFDYYCFYGTGAYRDDIALSNAGLVSPNLSGYK